ncbi:MAG: hypothetical protein AB8B73_16010 [Ekhidna sp.]
MKTLILIVFVLIANTTIGQIKFYTNNGTVETKSIDTSEDNVKLEVIIPEEAKNHEEISIQFQPSPDDGERWNDYYWRKDFTPAYLQGKTKLEFWLKKPGEETGDFCKDDYCNKIFRATDDYRRNYVSQPMRVKIYGKDFAKMIWENGEQKKKYEYTLLKSADLMIDYGPISNAVASEEGLFQMEKYSASGDNEVELFSNTGQVYMTHDLTSDEGGVNFILTEIEVGESAEVAIDMSGGGGGSSSKSSDPLEDVKTSIERALFMTVNERTSRYIEKPATSYSNGLISESVYEPMLKGKGAVRSWEKEAKRFSNRSEYINWKSGNIGNFEGQVLEIPVYKMSQVKSVDRVYRLKDGESGKTQTLKVLVGKIDERIFVATLAAQGTKKLTEEETKFWNHIESTFKRN